MLAWLDEGSCWRRLLFNFAPFGLPCATKLRPLPVLTQTRARGLAKENPNLLTPYPSGTSLCFCCCCCFINGFSASLMSCVCLPCPTGTREPTTSISDFSGEPRAGSSLGQCSLAQPLPAPSALTRPRVLRFRCACPRARHRPHHPRCPGEPGTWGLLQHFPPSPARASVSPPAAAVVRMLGTSLCCCSSLAGGQERGREPPRPGADRDHLLPAGPPPRTAAAFPGISPPSPGSCQPRAQFWARCAPKALCGEVFRMLLMCPGPPGRVWDPQGGFVPPSAPPFASP